MCSSSRAALPIQASEHIEAMLTTTIIFTVLVAAWGRFGGLAEHRSPRREHLRSGR